jgi:nitroimidazol reductase NimA-like FMN-containing flavoprotein (pyridoxamine 5'-phosphate oxidase superfamily)
VDVPGKVFPYGRFECDTSIEYRSVVVFGQIRIIAERNLKAAFFDALMTKYYAHTSDRPKSFLSKA